VVVTMANQKMIKEKKGEALGLEKAEQKEVRICILEVY